MALSLFGPMKSPGLAKLPRTSALYLATAPRREADWTCGYAIVWLLRSPYEKNNDVWVCPNPCRYGHSLCRRGCEPPSDKGQAGQDHPPEERGVGLGGCGHAVIGFLAEYDALPGLSQEAKTAKNPVKEGAPGHGCGHNIFGVASVASAVAVKDAMARHNIPGTLKVFGCPAAETVEGKVFMVRAGVFDGLSCCLQWHPSSENGVSLESSNALNQFEVEFFGQTAHAAGDPWHGRSALDGIELTDIGLNFLREHLQPTARLHYVITEGGGAPNVVPDHARAWYS